MKKTSLGLVPFLILIAAFAFAQDSSSTGGVDIDAFEEITPEIQEIDPGSLETVDKPAFEEITVKPIEVGDEEFEFEEYRPEPQAPVVVETEPEPAPAPEAPPVEVVEEPAVPEAPPVVQAPPAPPAPPVASAPPPPAPAPVAAPKTPSVRMVERAPVMSPAPAEPLIPVEAPPERERLRVPEEVQVASSYRPKELDLTVDKNYEQELSDLKRQLALLRERVIETKSRIVTYGEKVARGFTAGTRLTLVNQNDLGDDFLIESVTYYLDGHQVYSKKFDGESTFEQTVYKGSILPGKHKVDMEVTLRADEGMFDLSHSAKLKYTTSEYFTANEGKQLSIRVRFFDKGGVFASAEERPGISFEIAEEDAY